MTRVPIKFTKCHDYRPLAMECGINSMNSERNVQSECCVEDHISLLSDRCKSLRQKQVGQVIRKRLQIFDNRAWPIWNNAASCIVIWQLETSSASSFFYLLRIFLYVAYRLRLGHFAAYKTSFNHNFYISSMYLSDDFTRVDYDMARDS